MATDKPQSTIDEMLAGIGKADLDATTVFHNIILVGIYMGPGVTPGGIIMPDKLKDEDRWQGKVGAVLKIGPMAFQNDARNDFRDQQVKVGDWIVYRISDGIPLDIGGVHCRLIEDIHVKLTVPKPSMIY